jgi:hypothetical protein
MRFLIQIAARHPRRRPAARRGQQEQHRLRGLADTAYRSKKNEAFLAKGMFTSHIHQKKPPRRPMTERIARANAKRSAVRSAVEHVFAGQKHRMGLIVRTISIARARIKIGMANLAYNFQRLARLEGRTASA